MYLYESHNKAVKSRFYFICFLVRGAFKVLIIKGAGDILFTVWLMPTLFEKNYISNDFR